MSKIRIYPKDDDLKLGEYKYERDTRVLKVGGGDFPFEFNQSNSDRELVTEPTEDGYNPTPPREESDTT